MDLNRQAQQLINAVIDDLLLDLNGLGAILAQVRVDFLEVSGLFDLHPEPGLTVLDLLDQVTLAEGREAAS